MADKRLASASAASLAFLSILAFVSIIDDGIFLVLSNNINTVIIKIDMITSNISIIQPIIFAAIPWVDIHDLSATIFVASHAYAFMLPSY